MIWKMGITGSPGGVRGLAMASFARGMRTIEADCAGKLAEILRRPSKLWHGLCRRRYPGLCDSREDKFEGASFCQGNFGQRAARCPDSAPAFSELRGGRRRWKFFGCGAGLEADAEM